MSAPNPAGPDYEYNEWSDEEVPVSRTWLDATERWIRATNYTGTVETAATTQHLIHEVRRLRELIEKLRHTPRLWHDWNDGPPDHLWLLEGQGVVIADGDPTGPIEDGWRVKKAVRVEVERGPDDLFKARS